MTHDNIQSRTTGNYNPVDTCPLVIKGTRDKKLVMKSLLKLSYKEAPLGAT
jgi:hypothetical protein